ncbi:Synergin gamma [Clonorchis sinensis]|uniref:Synergin gamma n=2 Tax=Clonorchis sinensis TaxID=79923 RepID=A0A8T1MDN1_CLOSI|nr:Synergin gamma [Clonorchis sinensis]GAA55662.1 synergin gamma [Clonorchis sinensis]
MCARSVSGTKTSIVLNGSSSYSSDSELSNHKPDWLRDLRFLPPIYHRVIVATTTSYGLDSRLICQIFSSSGLSDKTLRHIWTIVNHSHPGWLTPSELVLALALIGVAQREQFDLRKPEDLILPHLTVNYLNGFTTPPVPRISVPIVSPITSNGPMITTQLSFTPPPIPVPKTSATNCFNGLPAHPDDDWADFTSFEKMTADAPKLADTSRILGNGICPDFMEHCTHLQKHSAVGSPFTVDDDFGDFQTSIGTSHTADPGLPQNPKLLSSENNISLIDNQSEVTRPNYNLSSDFQSYETPKQTIQYEWSRCLTQCLQVLNASLDSLSVLSSQSERDEFSSTPEGHEFFLDLFEVYRIAQRVTESASRYGLWTPELRSQASQLRMSFQNHAQWVTPTDLKSRFDILVQASLLDGCTILPVRTNSSYCGVCLDTFCPDSASTEADNVIPWAGRQYHASCANFWINRIQLSLPALVLP